MTLKSLFSRVVFVGLLCLPLAGCETTEVADFCNQKCLCDTCDTAAQDQCAADGDADQKRYEDAGCDYEGFLSCTVDTATCADTGFSFATTCQEVLLDSCESTPAES